MNKITASWTTKDGTVKFKDLKTGQITENKKVKENKKKDDEKYLDVNKILKHKRLVNLVITATGYRKTTNFARWVVENLLNEGGIYVWMRRWDAEIADNVVSLFQGLLAGKEGYQVSSSGVKFKNRKVIYFVSLNRYHIHKGITDIAHLIKAVIFDECIPINKLWYKGTSEKEGEVFADLMNPILRNMEIPLYLLGNPYAKATWFIARWFPHARPEPDKEKIYLEKNVLLFYAPLPKGKQSRGTIDLLESEEKQKITKYGMFPETEENYMSDIEPDKTLFSLIIKGQAYRLGKNSERNIYLISTVKDPQEEKNILILSARDAWNLNFTNIIRADDYRKHYKSLIDNLLVNRLLYFNDYSTRDNFFTAINSVSWIY